MADSMEPGTLRECPAPWCQAEQSEVEIAGYRGMEFVVCGHCGCTGPEGNSPEEAARLWNTRATDKALREALAALEPFAREYNQAGADHLPEAMRWVDANGDDAPNSSDPNSNPEP